MMTSGGSSHDGCTQNPGERRLRGGLRQDPETYPFPKGQSGNPAGRPKGAKNRVRLAGTDLTKLLKRELMREVEVRGKDGMENLSMLEAAARSLTVKAVKGDVAALKVVIALGRAVDAEEVAEREKQDAFWKDYKARKWEEIQRCHLTGQPEPQILPHPDDVVIDQHTGEVIIRGPANLQQKEEWDRLWAGKEAQEEELLTCEKELSDLPPDAGEDRDRLQDDIKEAKFFLTLYCMKLMTVFHLPASDVTDDRFLQDQLTQRVTEGLWPEPPKKLLKSFPYIDREALKQGEIRIDALARDKKPPLFRLRRTLPKSPSVARRLAELSSTRDAR